MTTIAHVSDLHVMELAGVPARRFLNKRVTGLAKLWSSRAHEHPVHIAERLVADLEAREADHVVVTGDLTNLSLEVEFERVRELLAPLAHYRRISLIPGNHDVYTRGSARRRRFEHYFGDLLWEPGETESTYPWHKRVGEVELVGLSSAVPRLPFVASGRVDAAQLERLERMAAEHGFHDRFVMGMVHHNLHPRGLRKNLMHGLANRDEVLTRCERSGVDLLLHGHVHVAHRFDHRGMRVVGSGSSTWNTGVAEHVARYNVYHVEGGRLRGLEVRVYDPRIEGFRSDETQSEAAA